MKIFSEAITWRTSHINGEREETFCLLFSLSGAEMEPSFQYWGVGTSAKR